MGDEIKLDPAEIMIACYVGVMRQVENLKRNRKPFHGAGNEQNWQLALEGCLGEFALAKFLNMRWKGKGRLREVDVGDNDDVRTRSRHYYDLILHADDPDDRRFWLLTGLDGQYVVRGWCYGREGKVDKYWSDPAGNRPAFFVPQKTLRSYEEWRRLQ